MEHYSIQTLVTSKLFVVQNNKIFVTSRDDGDIWIKQPFAISESNPTAYSNELRHRFIGKI